MSSIAPARYDLTIWRGSTFSKQFVYLSSVVPRTLKDLTGYTSSVRVYDSGTLATYVVAVDEVNGTLDFTIDAAATYTTWRAGNYELRTIAPDGTVSVILHGTIHSKGQDAA